MKPEEQKIKKLKVGEIYNVRVKVKTIGEDYIRVTPILQGGVLSTYWPTSFALWESSAFSPIPPENENSEPAPKYDPCRKFRKGDIVEPVERWGRKLRLNAGHYRIDKDEVDNRVMMTNCETGFSFAAIDTVYLKLITPVEELERYSVSETSDYWGIEDDEKCDEVALFWKDSHPHAKEAAEAECARLNEEYRKEQSCKVDA